MSQKPTMIPSVLGETSSSITISFLALKAFLETWKYKPSTRLKNFKKGGVVWGWRVEGVGGVLFVVEVLVINTGMEDKTHGFKVTLQPWGGICTDFFISLCFSFPFWAVGMMKPISQVMQRLTFKIIRKHISAADTERVHKSQVAILLTLFVSYLTWWVTWLPLDGK